MFGYSVHRRWCGNLIVCDFVYLEAMGTGTRTRPYQQQVPVPVKCITAGAIHLLWTSLLGILFFGLLLSYGILYSHGRSLSISRSGFPFSISDQHSTEIIRTYSRQNPAVSIERERIKFVLDATNYGRIRFKDALYSRRTRDKAGRHGRSWMLPFAHRLFEGYLPKFVELSKLWLGKDGDFNPGIMQDLVRTVKMPLDLNMAYWSRVRGNDSDHLNLGNKYQSCAVVGNSGILLKSNYGEEIDSHEMVIRLNNAQIYPYTEQVGSKTTISFINSNVLASCSVRPDCWCNPYGDDVPTILYICQAKHLLNTARCISSSRSAILLTHSLLDALTAAIVKWYSLTNFIQTTGRPLREWDSFHPNEYFHYSSGMEAVMLALGICDSVDLFGFGKSPNAKHHYHTEQKVEQALHDYAAEYLFYDDLVHNRTIPFLSDAGIYIPPVRIFV